MSVSMKFLTVERGQVFQFDDSDQLCIKSLGYAYKVVNGGTFRMSENPVVTVYLKHSLTQRDLDSVSVNIPQRTKTVRGRSID